MNILLNGEKREVSAHTVLSALLAEFGLFGERIAVERNGDIIKKSDYGSTLVEDGDTLEVVRFVGGG